MNTLPAKKANYEFSWLIDRGGAAPAAVVKHGRQVVVVMAVAKFERLKARNALATVLVTKRKAKE